MTGVSLVSAASGRSAAVRSGRIPIRARREGARDERVARVTPATGTTGLEGSRVVDIQRARILAAMTQVVSAHGAGSVTVAQVVEQAGVSRRTFYELFADCEECLLAAIEEAFSQATERVLAAYDRDRPWRVRVRSGLVALLGFLDEDRARARLLVVECLAAGQRALYLRQQALVSLTAAVDAGRGESKLGGGPASLLAGEGVVGGVVSLVHARVSAASGESLTVLANDLMSMIVLPYLGPAAARRELAQPLPPMPVRQDPRTSVSVVDPFKAAGMRLTYRTARVLGAIVEQPGSSNRQVGALAEVSDQGQISKLLARLEHLGLIHNTSAGRAQGEANAWALTEKGREVHAHTSIASVGGER